MSAEKISELTVGRVGRAVNDAAEALAGKPHVGTVERPEIDGRWICTHSFTHKRKAPALFSVEAVLVVAMSAASDSSFLPACHPTNKLTKLEAA